MPRSTSSARLSPSRRPEGCGQQTDVDRVVERVLVVVLDVGQAVDEALVLDDVVVDRLHEAPGRADLDGLIALVAGERFLEVDDAEEKEAGRALVEPLRDLLGGHLLDLDVGHGGGVEVGGELGEASLVLLLALGEDGHEGVELLQGDPGNEGDGLDVPGAELLDHGLEHAVGPDAELEPDAVEQQDAVADAEGGLSVGLENGRQDLEQQPAPFLEGVVFRVVDLSDLVDDVEAGQQVEAGLLEGLGFGPGRSRALGLGPRRSEVLLVHSVFLAFRRPGGGQADQRGRARLPDFFRAPDRSLLKGVQSLLGAHALEAGDGGQAELQKPL